MADPGTSGPVRARRVKARQGSPFRGKATRELALAGPGRVRPGCARLGSPGHGSPRLGMARPDTVWRGVARHDGTGQGKAPRCLARHDVAGRGAAPRGEAWLPFARPDGAGQDWADQYLAGQSRAPLTRTGPGLARQGAAGQDSARRGSAWLPSSGQGAARQGRAQRSSTRLAWAGLGMTVQGSPSLLLSPHSDDGALFASFTMIEHRPHIVTVLASVVQKKRGTGITQRQRVFEDACAMKVLGCSFENWTYSDARPDWDAIESDLQVMSDDYPTGHVFAPQPEPGGHEHHNRVGEIARRVFGDRVTHYLTYTAEGKSTWGLRVEPGPGMVPAKLRALACYESQADLANCQPHFLRGLDEYLAA